MALVDLLCEVIATASAGREFAVSIEGTNDIASLLLDATSTSLLLRLNASNADAIMASDAEGFCWLFAIIISVGKGMIQYRIRKI
jgi:hypothetical protein